MLGRNLGLTISCALGASAFLLPPGVSSDKDAALPIVSLDPKHQSLNLPCADCMPIVALSAAEDEEVNAGPYDLSLDFHVSEDGQTLLLDGQQLFPIEVAEETFENTRGLGWSVQELFTITRQTGEWREHEVQLPLQITGQSFSLGPTDILTPDGDEITTIKWNVFGLEGRMVELDEIVIQLLRTSEGELLILSIEAVPGPEDVSTIKPIDAPKHSSKPCQYLPGPLCELSNFLGSGSGGRKHGRPGCGGAAKKMSPFDGHMPGHIRPHFRPPPVDHDAYVPAGIPSHEGFHHRHHHHHHHGFFHAFAQGIENVLVPVILGIGAGMLVVSTGLLTGRLLGWVWFTVIRGGNSGYASVALDDTTATVKQSESEEDEPLPIYEDAPAYEPNEKEVV